MHELVARLRAAGCVFAEDEAALLVAEAGSPQELEAMTVRRVRGEPLEQILGWAAFAGLRVRLRPGVFVPRRRSELIVRLALEHLRPENGPISGLTGTATRAPHAPDRDRSVLRILDLGCGSGALGAAIAAAVPAVEVWAVDIDPDAVACARLNLPAERVLLGDLYDPLPAGMLADLICANAPYVPTDAIALMPPEAREHEHPVALDGGTDGLAVQRRLIGAAPRHLAAGGALLIETGRAQAEATAALGRTAGLAVRVVTDDGLEATVVVAHMREEVVHPPPADDLSR